MKISHKKVKEYFIYDQETGILKKKKRRFSRKNKDLNVGFKHVDKYIRISYSGKFYLAHRLIWFYMKGYFPENDIDHINGDGFDNRWNNLREASRSCNMRNCRISKNNRSGVVGVSLNKRTNKWEVSICENSKKIHIGVYENFNNAVKERWNAEIRYGYPSCNSTSTSYLYLKENNLI